MLLPFLILLTPTYIKLNPQTAVLYNRVVFGAWNFRRLNSEDTCTVSSYLGVEGRRKPLQATTRASVSS